MKSFRADNDSNSNSNSSPEEPPAESRRAQVGAHRRQGRGRQLADKNSAGRGRRRRAHPLRGAAGGLVLALVSELVLVLVSALYSKY